MIILVQPLTSASEYVREISVHGGLVTITDFLCFEIVFMTYSCDKKYLERLNRWFCIF